MNRTARRVLPGLLFAACLLSFVHNLPAHSFDHGLIVAGVPEGPEEGSALNKELLFKVINTSLLVIALAVLLRKPLAEFLTQRSASIQKSLEEGRKALEASQAQFNAVEEKLRNLEAEIAAFRATAAREMEAERERLRQASAEEAEKILASARAQLEAATSAAKLELMIFVAQQATEFAEGMIRERLDDASRRRLVSQFIAGLS